MCEAQFSCRPSGLRFVTTCAVTFAAADDMVLQSSMHLTLLKLLKPTPPLVDRQYLPIHLNILHFEYPFYLLRYHVEIMSRKRKDGGACS